MATRAGRGRACETAPVEGEVVGRDAELDRIARLLDSVGGGPAVLAFEGPAGIGKTTVWSAGVERARASGFATLTCRPTASEVRLSYAGLADLLVDLDPGVVDELPRPQGRALDAALLRADDDRMADPRATAAGFLSVLDRLAESSPVLVAIDDLQWLDEPTRRVVEFAVRRCTGPIAVVTTNRRGEGSGRTDELLLPRDESRLQRLQLGPMSLGALHHVIRQRTGRSLTRPSLTRITETSAGNPFYAVELARSIDSDATALAALPASLQSVVEERLHSLAAPVLHALLVASALGEPRVSTVAAAVGDQDALGRLGEAEDAGVVELIGGHVRFSHPLLAASVYSTASPTVRRELHRQLSGLVSDAEERARHLALSAVGPDPETIAALDAAAAQARARGAPSVAAELLDLARALGDDDPIRSIQAAHDGFDAGDLAGAQRLLEAAIAVMPPGPARAGALARLGMIRFEIAGSPDAATLCERAVDEADGDVGLRCSVALEAAFVLFNSGRGRDAQAVATRAVDDADELGDDGLLAEALACKVIIGFLLGDGTDEVSLARARDLEDADRRTHVVNQPLPLTGLIAWYSGRPDEALDVFAEVRQRCLDRGMEGEMWLMSAHFVAAACAAGKMETAHALVEELVEQARLVGTEQTDAFAQVARAQLLAWEGEVEAARAAGTKALAEFGEGQPATWPVLAYGALGMAELSVDDAAAAAEWLEPLARTAATVVGEPGAIPFFADAPEALIALGRIDDAEPFIELLEASGRRRDRLWARAVGARCRALVHAAQGRSDDATDAFGTALAAHEEMPQLRYDRARTLLQWGRLQRRTNRRRDARESLLEAAALFEEGGTAQWARNAREELERLGLRPGTDSELTPSEHQVAELAASGMTNREVAAALFVSPKTVEAHLGRVYRKLGIRSRAELGGHMARGAAPTSTN
jgi:DNA-binding CsgD family transcriptional regulator